MTTTSISANVLEHLREALPHCLTETNFTFGKKYTGKVRDVYDLGDRLLMITTDRQSAFDRLIAAVPYKGQALNLTSAWWFEQTEHLVPNHLIAVPDPNVMIVRKLRVFPVEFVVRGYITGVTSTSLWTHYQKGAREFCGNALPEGLRKNQRLAKPILTPTTKDKDHDRPISAREVVAEGRMSAAEWEEASHLVMQLYNFGAEMAARHGLILVDTKYELGQDENGRMVLVDEIHTQDSSRYWLADSYQKRFNEGLEPEYIDKEFLRLWFIEHCDPYKDEVLPNAPDELIVTLASRYVMLYQMITGNTFAFPPAGQAITDRIKRNVAGWLV